VAVLRTGAVLLLLAACHRPTTDLLPSEPFDPSILGGTLEIEVTDAKTGAPIPRCVVVGWDAGDVLTEVTPSLDGHRVAPDGRHRFAVPRGVCRVRLAAHGYSETWSGDASVAAGRTQALAVAMEPLARLVVRVVETDGAPVAEGTLLVTGVDPMGADRIETLSIRSGLADQLVDAGRVAVEVDPTFLPDYVPQQAPATLRPGERTDLTLTVVRRPRR
jgi:hypothetical protein